MTVQFRRRPARPNASADSATHLARSEQPHPRGFADQQMSLLPPPQWLQPAVEIPASVQCQSCPRSAPERTERAHRRWARFMARLAYRLIRPVVRPLAWRARGFLLTEVLPQLELVRSAQAGITETLASLSNRQMQLHETLRAKPAVTISPEISANGPPNGPASRRKIHQFHAGSATGDAITNAMLMIRNRLRAQGYESEIFVEHLGAGLEAELLPLDDLPLTDDHVLLVHHSMGHARFTDVAASPAPKVLIYHNITPPELLPHDAGMRQAARLGRAQLLQWRPHVCAALADSPLNGMELRGLGYPEVAEASLLFDVETLLSRAATAAPREAEAPFTVLFVGRMVASKGQAELVDAFAAFAPAFRREHGRPARLVLAGTHQGEADPALVDIRGRIAAHGISSQVTVTGKLSDEALFAWFGRADLYVSLSRHEGFGVPLVEAQAHGIPVVALAAAAVPYTLGQAGMLVHDVDPIRVSHAMLEAARAPRAQGGSRPELQPWRLEHHWPVLERALARAGASMPPDLRTLAAIAAGQHIVVTGQINGSYSLAVVNRQMALSLEAARPGQVRLLPIENDAPARLTDVPKSQRTALAELVARRPAATGPVVAISQHYPLLVPDCDADARMAMLFWEETLLPEPIVQQLNTSFQAVLAPTRAIARALADSGVHVPIRVVGFAPDLHRFEAVGLARARRLPRDPAPITQFLHVSSCFARKGVDVLLEAWSRAFGAEDRVRLVIKGFPNQHNDVADRIHALRAAAGDLADIVFINRDMSADALVALYAEADVMVLPSRGEGYNIPAAEALASGLRLIVTGFGGHMDFCTRPDVTDRVRLLDYRLVRSQSHVAARHALWAEPDVDDLVRALREAAGLRRPPERSRAAPSIAPPSGTWAQHLCRTQAELLLAPQPRRPRLAWVTPWRQACGVAEYSRHLLASLPAEQQPLILCDERPVGDGSDDRAQRLTSQAAFRFGDSLSAPQLATAIAVQDPDVLMIQHQPGLLPWEGLARLLESPALRRRCVVITLHNSRNLLLSEPMLRTRVAAALARTRRVLVHSLDDLAVLQDLGVTNTAWLPHGTTSGPRPLPPRDMGDAPIIGTTGFFLPHKGISLLIEALALLRVDWPGITLKLVCARYPDPISDAEMDRCRSLARLLEIEDALIWHPQFLANEARLDLLSGCDLVVMPYEPTQESASGAVRQALASGAPTIVSDLPIFDDLGDAVARVANPSPAALAHQIQALLARPGARAELQQRAQAWLADHDWQRIGERLDGMLQAYHQEHLLDR